MINLNNKKTIHISSVISGVLPISYLITNTELKENNQISSNTHHVRLIGYILSITTFLISIILIQRFVIETGFFNNKVQGYIFAFLIFLLVQIMMSYSFIFICKKLFADTLKFSINVSNRKVLFYYLLNVSIGLIMTIYLFVYGPSLFVFASVCSIPNIYLYSRIKKVFNSGKSIVIFTFVFLIIACTFILSYAAFENINNGISRSIVYAGYYYTPWLFYTFLLYLLWDFITFSVSIKFKISDWVNTYQVRRTIFFVIALIAFVVEIGGIINFNNTRVQKYNIQITKDSALPKELKIAMAADCHFSEITNDYFVGQFVNKLNAMSADLVFFVGDIFESSGTNVKMRQIQEQLKQINSKYGVYAVEGNHDYYSNANISGSFQNSNIKLLRDTVIVINNSYQIVGRMDRHNQNRISLDSLLNPISKDLPVIVLDHQPNNDLAGIDKVDLYLSGHTHNGQLFPFNLIVKLIYDLSWGHKVIGNTHYFVTCGAQGWGPQVKTASFSEIMEINIDLN